MSGHRPDLYAILQVDRTATQGEIRSAYRRLLRALHPDLQPGVAEAARTRRELQAVMEAYEVLGDPGRRAEYDRATAPGPAGSAGRPAAPDFVVLDVEVLLEYFLRRGFPWWPRRGQWPD
jgi:curved DNA-binding protein CbpA